MCNVWGQTGKGYHKCLGLLMLTLGVYAIWSEQTVTSLRNYGLKNNSMSQSCRAHLFFGARLIQQNSRFEFFFFFFAYFFFVVVFVFVLFCFVLFCFFPQFFMNLFVKIYMKRYDRHNKTFWTTDYVRLLQPCVLSCILFIQKSSSIFQSCDRLKSDTSAVQEKKKSYKKLHLCQVFQSVTSFET